MQVVGKSENTSRLSVWKVISRIAELVLVSTSIFSMWPMWLLSWNFFLSHHLDYLLSLLDKFWWQVCGNATPVNIPVDCWWNRLCYPRAKTFQQEVVFSQVQGTWFKIWGCSWNLQWGDLLDQWSFSMWFLARCIDCKGCPSLQLRKELEICCWQRL